MRSEAGRALTWLLPTDVLVAWSSEGRFEKTIAIIWVSVSPCVEGSCVKGMFSTVVEISRGRTFKRRA